jgi:hypothetical protein
METVLRYLPRVSKLPEYPLIYLGQTARSHVLCSDVIYSICLVADGAYQWVKTDISEQIVALHMNKDMPYMWIESVQGDFPEGLWDASDVAKFKVEGWSD